MRLTTAYVRFYRAFNYDFLRKARRSFQPDPWDEFEDGTHYPYIKVPIDPNLTCVVGANESGKSQLLNVIQAALGQGELSASDFCRYSDFLSETGDLRVPDVGLHFEDLDDEESSILQNTLAQDVQGIRSFRIFRVHPSRVFLFLDGESSPIELPADSDEASSIDALLPKVVRIDPNSALPDSVPLDYLLSPSRDASSPLRLSRADQLALLDSFLKAAPTMVQKLENPTSESKEVERLVEQLHNKLPINERDRYDYDKRLGLARDLLMGIAKLTPKQFSQLHEAFRGEHQEGLTEAIQTYMNERIRDSLNLAKWWSQDSQFRLTISAHEHDVVLTITDRTSRQYTFDERSDGLRYFLSYLVQALTHLQSRSRPEILLMDEPDTYLSNDGQQDLLRVFNEFTEESEDRPGAQVIYVTHSPFLIDRNRGDRIRVLDKGIRDEGVRVVKDIGKNHFEPIRTALGEFVGETVFIGNCNLILEGMADQIYVAGFSEILSRNERVPSTDYLDLNRLTLVAAGGASEVPFRVYLARGLDADKPAVIALLDGDEAGSDAIKELKRTTPYRRKLLRDEYIAQVSPEMFAGFDSDWDVSPNDMEDLVPVEISVKAARSFLTEMDVEYDDSRLSEEVVKGRLPELQSMFKAIRETVKEATKDLNPQRGPFDLPKVPFARHVVSVCDGSEGDAAEVLLGRFAVLFHRLTTMQRQAERERNRDAISRRVGRETSRFFTDKWESCTKVDVTVLLDTVEHTIDVEYEGKAVLREIDSIHAEFELDQDPHERIRDEVKPHLRDRLRGLRLAEIQDSQPEEDQAEEWPDLSADMQGEES
ncbi:MAG: AAA family ATPase [Chloroflexi bacterium]|nr:AAA family ATPase [Chloroflexota bacterium]MYC02764.1 AAA family ATPase [Chloroflexota bacterium]